jgi:histidinol-phosphatase
VRTRSALTVKGVCVNDGGGVLLCRNWRDEWELPGGRPEAGEEFEDCLHRELAEETGLSVVVHNAVDASGALEVEPGRWVHIVAYSCRTQTGSRPAGSAEHQEVRFFGRDELADLRLPSVYRKAIELSHDEPGTEGEPSPVKPHNRALQDGLLDLRLALDLADEADQLALSRFRSPALTVETKSDGSPVTNADVEIERILRARLANARPDHGVIGEEAGASRHAVSSWYIDPIDGTSRFVIGDPRWYTLIGLAHGDTVTVGVASAPALGRRWWALNGAGSFCNGRPLAVSTATRLAEATVNDDWRNTLSQGIRDRPLSTIARQCARIRPHDGHSYLAVAGGDGDIAAGAGGGPWDYAAMKAIVEGAGGRFTDLQGADSFNTGSALVSNGLVHDEALTQLARVHKRLS